MRRGYDVHEAEVPLSAVQERLAAEPVQVQERERERERMAAPPVGLVLAEVPAERPAEELAETERRAEVPESAD